MISLSAMVRRLPLLAALIGANAALAEGSFKVLPPVLESNAHAAQMQELQDSGVLQMMVAEVNKLFKVDRDIGVRFAECGQSNAFFYPAKMEILMCAEMVVEMEQDFAQVIADEQARQEAVMGAFAAVLLHEVGHALVSALQIPITGREEDAVDQLSAWVLIESGMAEDVLSSAATYYSQGTANDRQMAGEHSLNQQRYYNQVCWVFGSNPDGFMHLLSDWGLPEARARRCPNEYAQLRNSWARLLDGHLRVP